jgi:ABC-type antimicrobial peptide transport system permease subunit
MLKHVANKIKSYRDLFFYQQIYIFIAVLVIFLLLGFRNASLNKIESQIIFYNNSVLIYENVSTSYVPKGLKLSDKQIKEIDTNFQFVNVNKSISIESGTLQHVKFSAVSDDFIETGVAFSDLITHTITVQKLDLIHGNVWKEDSTAPVVVIDEATANLVFGHTNVLGKFLPTQYGQLEIIGIVSDTMERKQMIEQVKIEGQAIDDSIYATDAYVSHGYVSTLTDVTVFNRCIIVKDNRLGMTELKQRIKEILNVPSVDTSVVRDRQDIIDNEIISRKVFFQIIVSVISVFAVLGIINLVNVSLFFYRINRKNIGIYKAIGCSNKQWIILSLLEGLLISLVTSVGSIAFGMLVLIVGTAFAKTILFINFFRLLLASLVIIAVITFTETIVSLLTAAFRINKKPLYYLRGE